MPTGKAQLTSNSIEWYTPPDLAQEIAAFFGGIDLDPCADPGHHIPALRHETENGLGITWRGRVFVNPPYGKGLQHWVDKALSDPVDEVILLLPARVDTRWFQPIWQHTICFFRGRLVFKNPLCNANAPFPCVLVYRGPRGDAFRAAFSHRGHVVVNESPAPAAYQLPLLVA